MTPLQLVQAECANYEHNGGCLGAYIGDKGQITHCSPTPRCVLSTGERCAYFEECVAPMTDMVKEPRRAKAIHEVVHGYRMAHAGVVIVKRPRRQGGRRSILTSQKARQGPCLPLQQRQSQNPYQGSPSLQRRHATVGVPA